jgi:hypothetical protein
MKNIILYLASILLISCNNKNQNLSKTPTQVDSSIFHSENIEVSKDTIEYRDTIIDDTSNVKYIEPDVFIFSNEEFFNYEASNKFPYFKSNKLNCNLFCEPYTDGSVTNAIMCRGFNMPESYMNGLASEGFSVKETKPIQIERIQTLKGININTRRSKIIDIFGNPDSTISKKGIDKLFWNFKMKESKSKQYDSRKLQPFLLKGLRFDIEMHFKNQELIILIYSYEVP